MRSINLNRQLVGIEDLLIGFGTVMQTRGGQQVQVTKLNAGSLPFNETQSLLQWAQTVNLAELGAIVEELTIVANNKDNIVSVSNNSVNINLVAGLNNEINALYTNLVAIQSNYTNIDTLIGIYNNMSSLLLIASQIIPNITEILNVDVLATQVANDKASVATMKLAVETIYDTFDDRFLGSKSTDPTVDNDGNALIDGAMYFNTSSNDMKVYDLGNTLWVTIPQIYLSGLLDVQLTSITTGDLLTWNGTKWVNTRTPKVNSIQLNGGNSTEGILSWNANEGTAGLTLPGGSTLQIGQEEVRTVRNSTASPIPDGTLVMFDGTIGNSGRVKVKPFTGGFSEAHLLYGMTTQLIAANSDGIINIAGKVRGINTTGSLYGETWVDGDILYAKPDNTGALTKVVPADDKLKLRVAAVVHSHTLGTLEIRFTPFNENMYYTKTQSDALKVPINLSAAIDKTTPVDTDLIAISDSASSFSLKKLSWLNLKATIKTYFDTLFVKKIVSVDNTVPRFNSNTGELKTSGVTIDDNNHIGIGTSTAASNATTNISDTRLANTEQYGINNNLIISPETLTASRNYFGTYSNVSGTFANTSVKIPSVFGSYNIGTILSGSNSTANNGTVSGSFSRGSANNTADATNKYIEAVIGTRGSAYINIAGYNNVENMYGVYADVTSGGTLANGSGVTNAYGVFITNTISSGAVTNNYGLYQATAGAKNYFAGPVTANGGLVFSNTSIANANTLDYYEEGAFTPTVYGAATEGVGAYSSQQGYYTRIGNVCRFSLYLVITDHTGTGHIRLGGLPFSSVNHTDNYNSFSIGYINTLTYTGTNLSAYMNPNTSYIMLAQYSSGATTTGVPIDTSFGIMISGSYKCA